MKFERVIQLTIYKKTAWSAKKTDTYWSNIFEYIYTMPLISFSFIQFRISEIRKNTPAAIPYDTRLI